MITLFNPRTSFHNVIINKAKQCIVLEVIHMYYLLCWAHEWLVLSRDVLHMYHFHIVPVVFINVVVAWCSRHGGYGDGTQCLLTNHVYVSFDLCLVMKSTSKIEQLQM